MMLTFISNAARYAHVGETGPGWFSFRRYDRKACRIRNIILRELALP